MMNYNSGTHSKKGTTWLNASGTNGKARLRLCRCHIVIARTAPIAF